MESGTSCVRLVKHRPTASKNRDTLQHTGEVFPDGIPFHRPAERLGHSRRRHRSGWRAEVPFPPSSAAAHEASPPCPPCREAVSRPPGSAETSGFHLSALCPHRRGRNADGPAEVWCAKGTRRRRSRAMRSCGAHGTDAVRRRPPRIKTPLAEPPLWDAQFTLGLAFPDTG